MTNKEIGAKIQELRIKRGLTKNALANKAGVSPTYIYQLETGLKNPTVEYLEYICEAMDITLAQFFKNEASDERISNVLDKLNEKQKASLAAFLESLQ